LQQDGKRSGIAYQALAAGLEQFAGALPTVDNARD
jgi:hypothetical protein